MNPRDFDIRSDKFINNLLAEDFCAQVIPESEYIVVTGSLVQGWGNDASDIDLIAVISSDSVPDFRYQVKNRAGITVISGKYMDTPVDLEVIPSSYLADIKASISHAKAADLSAALSISDDMKTSLNNLRLGIPLYGDRRFYHFRESFPWSGLAKLLMIQSDNYARSLLYDTIGAVDSMNGPTAYICSLELVGAAVETSLHAVGDTSIKGKWRLKRLLQKNMTHVADLYIDSWLQEKNDDKDLIERAEERILSAQEVLQISQELLHAGEADRK